MWKYEKKLQYPINIKKKDLRMAKYLVTQYGGSNGELAAALRYLNQRYTMPDSKGKALLTDIGTEELQITSFTELQRIIEERGKKGVTLQRFKGLGEMMPQQLWETTMDPATRTLLKVNLDDAMLCDQIFDVLMGDKVEPRRDFIDAHAVYATNIDV